MKSASANVFPPFVLLLARGETSGDLLEAVLDGPASAFTASFSFLRVRRLSSVPDPELCRERGLLDISSLQNVPMCRRQRVEEKAKV